MAEREMDRSLSFRGGRRKRELACLMAIRMFFFFLGLKATDIILRWKWKGVW